MEQKSEMPVMSKGQEIMGGLGLGGVLLVGLLAYVAAMLFHPTWIIPLALLAVGVNFVMLLIAASAPHTTAG